MERRTAFPYLLASQVVALKNNKLSQFVVECRKISNEYDDLLYKYAGLIRDNQRLQNENDFMLKLIEKHGFGE